MVWSLMIHPEKDSILFERIVQLVIVCWSNRDQLLLPMRVGYVYHVFDMFEFVYQCQYNWEGLDNPWRWYYSDWLSWYQEIYLWRKSEGIRNDSFNIVRFLLRLWKLKFLWSFCDYLITISWCWEIYLWRKKRLGNVEIWHKIAF